MNELIPIENIQSKIYIIRGKKVMLDRDLAILYNIGTRDLNKAVSRNIERFPEDFMFMLNQKEFDSLKFHFGTSNRGGTRKLPRVFTEQGVAMLSGILRSNRAVIVNIQIMRAFVKMRELISSNINIHKKLKDLETKYTQHDKEIGVIFEAIKQLMEPELPEENKKKIGFITGK